MEVQGSPMKGKQLENVTYTVKLSFRDQVQIGIEQEVSEHIVGQKEQVYEPGGTTDIC